MSIEANKQVEHQFYNALQNKDYAAAAQLCHPTLVFYLLGERTHT